MGQKGARLLEWAMAIPQRLRLLFWDTDVDVFDPTAYPVYTIERVLEYGDEEAIAWLGRTFTQDHIRTVLCTDRRLTRLSATFWALILGVPASNVAALRTAS